MSRGSSRLHQLERHLKASRPSRAKARALTVMRLEEGANGVRTTTRPPRLPKDMEDQIAVVRGRTAGKPSRGLLQLEERLLKTDDVVLARQVIQRHEHGTSPAPRAFHPQPRAQATSIASGFGGGSYHVESFENPSAESPEPVVIPPIPPITPITPINAEPDRSVLTSDQMAVAADFERDIAAMLGSPGQVNAPEDNQWNSTLHDAAKPKTSPTANVPAVEPPDTPVAPKPDAHEVFNQMGLAMNYANNFDLGSMDMSARFDRFDQELALDAKSTPVPARRPVQALALDDFDLVADLAEISGAQSATPAETTNEPPTTSPEPETTPADL